MQARGRELSFSLAERTTSPTPGVLPVKASVIGGQFPRPIADAAPGPLLDKLRPHLPKPVELAPVRCRVPSRSEEHTSELQSHSDLVCRLLLEKKNGIEIRDVYTPSPLLQVVVL